MKKYVISSILSSPVKYFSRRVKYQKKFQVELTVGKNLKYRVREFVNVCSDHHTEQHTNN